MMKPRRWRGSRDLPLTSHIIGWHGLFICFFPPIFHQNYKCIYIFSALTIFLPDVPPRYEKYGRVYFVMLIDLPSTSIPGKFYEFGNIYREWNAYHYLLAPCIFGPKTHLLQIWCFYSLMLWGPRNCMYILCPSQYQTQICLDIYTLDVYMNTKNIYLGIAILVLWINILNIKKCV